MPAWGSRSTKKCRVDACTRTVYAHSLCQKHYRRARSGKTNDGDICSVGDQDGFGLYGIVDEDAVGMLLCHECGIRIAGLGVHVYQTHGMTARQYKELHGLDFKTSLLPKKSQELKSLKAKSNVGSPGWREFERLRNPAAARNSRTDRSFDRRGRSKTRQEEQSIKNGRSVRKGVVRACVVCGAEWCPIPPSGYKRVTCSDNCWRTLLSRRRRDRS